MCCTEVEVQTKVRINIDHFIIKTLFSDSGCCWANNVRDVREFTLHSLVDTRLRSDTKTANRSPVSATIPNIRFVLLKYILSIDLSYSFLENLILCGLLLTRRSNMFVTTKL